MLKADILFAPPNIGEILPSDQTYGTEIFLLSQDLRDLNTQLLTRPSFPFDFLFSLRITNFSPAGVERNETSVR